MRKGMKVRYTSGHGGVFSAIVRRAHRDGSATIIVHFLLDPAGQKNVRCFQDHKFRVHTNRLAELRS